MYCIPLRGTVQSLGGFELTSPRLAALATIACSLLPFVWLTFMFVIGRLWLKGISAVFFVVFGLVAFVIILLEKETVVSDRDVLREIIAEKQIDRRSRSVIYRVDGSYRQDWIEITILPGIIWGKRLSQERIE